MKNRTPLLRLVFGTLLLSVLSSAPTFPPQIGLVASAYAGVGDPDTFVFNPYTEQHLWRAKFAAMRARLDSGQPTYVAYPIPGKFQSNSQPQYNIFRLKPSSILMSGAYVDAFFVDDLGNEFVIKQPNEYIFNTTDLTEIAKEIDYFNNSIEQLKQGREYFASLGSADRVVEVYDQQYGRFVKVESVRGRTIYEVMTTYRQVHPEDIAKFRSLIELGKLAKHLRGIPDGHAGNFIARDIDHFVKIVDLGHASSLEPMEFPPALYVEDGTILDDLIEAGTNTAGMTRAQMVKLFTKQNPAPGMAEVWADGILEIRAARTTAGMSATMPPPSEIAGPENCTLPRVTNPGVGGSAVTGLNAVVFYAGIVQYIHDQYYPDMGDGEPCGSQAITQGMGYDCDQARAQVGRIRCSKYGSYNPLELFRDPKISCAYVHEAVVNGRYYKDPTGDVRSACSLVYYGYKLRLTNASDEAIFQSLKDGTRRWTAGNSADAERILRDNFFYQIQPADRVGCHSIPGGRRDPSLPEWAMSPVDNRTFAQQYLAAPGKL